MRGCDERDVVVRSPARPACGAGERPVHRRMPEDVCVWCAQDPPASVVCRGMSVACRAYAMRRTFKEAMLQVVIACRWP